MTSRSQEGYSLPMVIGSRLPWPVPGSVYWQPDDGVLSETGSTASGGPWAGYGSWLRQPSGSVVCCSKPRQNRPSEHTSLMSPGVASQGRSRLDDNGGRVEPTG